MWFNYQPPTSKNICWVHQQPSLPTIGAVWNSDSALVRRCGPAEPHRGLGHVVPNFKMTNISFANFVHLQVFQATCRKEVIVSRGYHITITSDQKLDPGLCRSQLFESALAMPPSGLLPGIQVWCACATAENRELQPRQHQETGLRDIRYKHSCLWPVFGAARTSETMQFPWGQFS